MSAVAMVTANNPMEEVGYIPHNQEGDKRLLVLPTQLV